MRFVHFIIVLAILCPLFVGTSAQLFGIFYELTETEFLIEHHESGEEKPFETLKEYTSFWSKICAVDPSALASSKWRQLLFGGSFFPNNHFGDIPTPPPRAGAFVLCTIA